MTIKEPTGPLSYENWRAKLRGEPWLGTSEFPLHTDAHVTGEITERLGPYHVLNTIRIMDRDPEIPALVFRIEHRLAAESIRIPMDKTNFDQYHGGTLVDELTALVSLCVGIRLKAGGENRTFSPNQDPLGRPYTYTTHQSPILLKARGFPPMLPSMLGTHSLANAELLGSLPDLSAKDATALVRSARVYQDAIWIGESEPELAWLMLVTAIESAAQHWREGSEAPVERLKASKPELYRVLELAGGVSHAEEVAKMVVSIMGATKKFLDFLLRFKPLPPAERPKFATVSWEEADLRKSLTKIYDWRSKALHAGSSFPAPMCWPPTKIEGGYNEGPLGTAGGTGNAVWRSEDTPMMLHTFEYIVRGSLTNWWKSMIPLAQ